ncbi:MAG TPA: glycosyltransferase family 2 protein [Alphaproteobacteria bacterium]|nr:glycosyltransferase family 2 protein [Alphaproteobacteria bacterium]
MRRALTIISPVFNEEDVIESFYNELKKTLDSIDTNYKSKILFVIDRCTDRTLEIIDRLAQRDHSVSYLVMSSRFGHQMSLLAGIDTAKSDVYIMMDSDLQHPPALINDMLKCYEEGFEVVYTLRKTTEKQGLIRKLCSKYFYRLMNALSDASIYENAADFRLISEKVAIVFRQQIRERNMFLRGLVSWVGFKQKSLEYIAAPRFAGKSKYSVAQMFKLAGDALISFSTFPLTVSLIVGTFFSLLGFLYALTTFFQFILYRQLPNGWTTLIILITIFSGVQLLCLGMVGAYVGGIYSEVKKRPHYIIDHLINYQEV